MKTELLAILASIAVKLDDVIALAAVLPNDPLPLPTGLRVINTYGGTDSPLSIEIGWDDELTNCTGYLDYMGAPGNPAGPQEWTPIQVNGAVSEVRATFTLQNPTGQSIVFRLRWQSVVTGEFSAPIMLAFPTL